MVSDRLRFTDNVDKLSPATEFLKRAFAEKSVLKGIICHWHVAGSRPPRNWCEAAAWWFITIWLAMPAIWAQFTLMKMW